LKSEEQKIQFKFALKKKYPFYLAIAENLVEKLTAQILEELNLERVVQVETTTIH